MRTQFALIFRQSLEIEEKINKIKWCPSNNNSHFLLTTNGKLRLRRSVSRGAFSSIPFQSFSFPFLHFRSTHNLICRQDNQAVEGVQQNRVRPTQGQQAAQRPFRPLACSQEGTTLAHRRPRSACSEHPLAGVQR
jgi:hypothetical protein